MPQFKMSKAINLDKKKEDRIYISSLELYTINTGKLVANV